MVQHLIVWLLFIMSCSLSPSLLLNNDMYASREYVQSIVEKAISKGNGICSGEFANFTSFSTHSSSVLYKY